MALFSLVGLVIYTVASGVVGVRLLLRARKSHGVPELLAGISYLAAPAIGYPLAVMAPQVPNRAVGVPMHMAGEFGVVFGCCCFLFFTVKVFRPGAVWASTLAWLGSAILVWSGVSIVMAFTSYTDPVEVVAKTQLPLSWMVGILLLSYIWIAYEGFRYYRMMRKRMTLGMADGVVTNRFLLWTLSGLTSTSWISVAVFMLATHQSLTNPINVFATCLGGIVNTVLLVLIFMPPGSYVRWVQRLSQAPQLATA